MNCISEFFHYFLDTILKKETICLIVQAICFYVRVGSRITQTKENRMQKLLKNMLLSVMMLAAALVSAQGIDFKGAMEKIQAGGPEAQAILSMLPADFEQFQAMTPGGQDFRVIYDFDPRTYNSKGYTVDNSQKWTGDIRQVAFWLQYKDAKDQDKWVFATIDAFSQKFEDYGVPTVDIVNAREVDNLFAVSNVEGFKGGFFPKGNIEFWGVNYGPGNAKKGCSAAWARPGRARRPSWSRPFITSR